MKKYVLCVATINYEEVILIKKNRPAWQDGFYNFPGGKIEESETSDQACIREFLEETGIDTSRNSVDWCTWYQVGQIIGYDYVVDIWHSDYETFNKVKTMTDEEVVKVKISDLSNMRSQLIHNVSAIVENCLDTTMKHFIMQYL